MTNYFLDTEFNDDGRTIDLISIGIVTDDGREFYAVNQDVELHRVHPWVRENVLPQLPPYGDKVWMPHVQIANAVRSFIDADIFSRPAMWGYYADYDWVAFCQLFGRMVDLPKGLPKFCRDLKQLSVDKGSPTHPPQESGRHNALDDARWNKRLFEFLYPLPWAVGGSDGR